MRSDYLKEVRNIPKIPYEEILKMPKEQMKEQLVLQNLMLVLKVAHSLKVPDYEFDDYISVGNYALIKAAENFNPESDGRFSTYAYISIKNNMRWEMKKKFRKKRNGTTVQLDEENFNLIEEENNDRKIIDWIENYILENYNKTEQEILFKIFGLFGYERKTKEELKDEYNTSRYLLLKLEKDFINKMKDSKDLFYNL